ncbi:MAG: putative terminase large subunit [Prokaryotic dsDNA virus sp.]|nr:MAG: putative terminase large subunit [Prokaryotic dsDNA virus sp.]
MLQSKKLNKIFDTLTEVWKPPPNLTIDLWADKYRKLSSESSAEAGTWRTDRVPFQREIMQCITDSEVEEIVFMKSAQVGATEMLLNAVGYYIEQEPSTILCMQPTLQMSMAFSKDRLAPMIRDTEVLKGKIKDPRSKDADNTTLHKRFPGGAITIVGANSASGLASRPIRILLCDEVDRYPPSAGTEGDPINLAKKRTTTFWNRKIILTSTPTIKGISRIEKAYEESDQRTYQVPCPECKHKQELKWQNIKWQDNKPNTVVLACEECGAAIDETKKQWMLLNGTWQKKNPQSKKPGFHISELYSPFRTWEQLVEDFLQAKKSPELLQTFVNTTLGGLWEEQGEAVEHEGLLEMCEEYNEQTIPNHVLAITAGVDTQKNRLEVQVIGWGINLEAYVLEYKIIWGEPSTAEVWQKLNEFLGKVYVREDNKKILIAATAIDSGFMTDAVYSFTKLYRKKRLYAIKGMSNPGKPIAGKPTLVGKRKNLLYPVGTDTAKEWIFARLQSEENLIHFPNTLDDEYFLQLTSEKRVPRYNKGKKTLVWQQIRKRNEALDTFVYALAAVQILHPDFELLKHGKKTKAEPKQQESIVQQRRRLYQRKPRNFVNSWRD